MKRLQEERLTFDNQLESFERTLKAKKQDALELELMSRDANHAKEVAKVSEQVQTGVLFTVTNPLYIGRTSSI